MPLFIFIPLSVLCAGVILYRYYHAGKLTAGGGWAAIILAIGAFGSGLAGAFPWSGLAFFFLGGSGLIVILQDAAIRRRSRRAREPAVYDAERNS